MIDASGTPVARARIVVSAGSVPVPEIALLSDDDGRFAVRLPRGSFTLRAHDQAGVGEAEVKDENVDYEIVIVIDR